MKMAYNHKAREKEIENKLRKDYFSEFDAEGVLGDIDFAVGIPQDDLHLFEQEFLLWAEAKKSDTHDIKESVVQLILTIGKARTFDHHLPPAFLGAFDAEKIAFVPYYHIMDVFSLSYINWNVRPSDHGTDTFRLLKGLVSDTLDKELIQFSFAEDDAMLRTFIRRNFVSGKSKISKVRINKTNFTAIYQKWLKEVKPSIAADWDSAKKKLILDADFYLADIMSSDNCYLPLKDKLRVLLKRNQYIFDREIDESGFFKSRTAEFKDNQQAHTLFWNRYERPPRPEYWDYIVMRRDLLVPQDIREVKGSFFTPAQWVSLSQEYLSQELGDNWQEEYYIWDCAAGTGNLLANLTNKYNIWASTLDPADVRVMHDRIKTMNAAAETGRQGANLLPAHVFQFDFLNDPFTKLPEKLQDIINDPEKRKKLIIYINPPYAEAGSTYSRKAKVGVSNTTKVHKDYTEGCGKYAKRELFAQFFMRIYRELPNCILAEFSTLKILQGPYFREFRNTFRAKLGRNFCVPAYTFDNVRGKFPIGFFIWYLDGSEVFQKTTTDVYDANGYLVGKKTIQSYENAHLLNDWLRPTWGDYKNTIGWLVCNGNDFQHQNELCILSRRSNETSTFFKPITIHNIIRSCIYFAVRHCVEANWLNDRDQFLSPDDEWNADSEFQSDCLVYAIFHGQNRISCKQETNNWIPFTEIEVVAQEKFRSHLMTDMIAGKELNYTERGTVEGNLFSDEDNVQANLPMTFSPAAQSVFDAGRALWHYYHRQPNAMADASLYDIRLHFQGTHTDKKGKEVMNNESKDPQYTALLAELRLRMKTLARQIEPKIYDYGFLKRNYDPLIKPLRKKQTKPEYMPPFDEAAEVERPSDTQDITVQRIIDLPEALQSNIQPLGCVKVVNVNIGPQFNGTIGQVIMHADNINNKEDKKE